MVAVHTTQFIEPILQQLEDMVAIHTTQSIETIL